jgi:hypothetical protein
MSLSLLDFLFLRKQASNTINPTKMAAPPTEATMMPATWDLESGAFAAAICVGWAVVLLVVVGEVWDCIGEPVAVTRFDADAGLVEVVILELVELEELEVGVVDAIITMLGIEVSITNVAVMTLCVFGKAFVCPRQISYAFASTASVSRQHPFTISWKSNIPVALLPVQKPTFSSDTIHCTAPSPIVYPLVLLLEQRQSNVGVVPHTDSGKFELTNDSKHTCAHDGMKASISGDNVMALTRVEEYKKKRIYGQHNAIIVTMAERRQHTPWSFKYVPASFGGQQRYIDDAGMMRLTQDIVATSWGPRSQPSSY